MYMHFARQFMRSVRRQGCEEKVKYSEYFRDGWTFHGKGLQKIIFVRFCLSCRTLSAYILWYVVLK